MEITFKDAAEAAEYLTGKDTLARALGKMTKTAMVTAAVEAGLLNPRAELVRWSRVDLIGYVMDKRYPLDTVNLAIHVRTHTRNFDGCEHCQERARLAEDTFALIERSEAGQR